MSGGELVVQCAGAVSVQCVVSQCCSPRLYRNAAKIEAYIQAGAPDTLYDPEGKFRKHLQILLLFHMIVVKNLI